MKYKFQNKCGFTLMEIMVALAIVSVFSIGLYKVYSSMTMSNQAQTQVLEIQQNLRGAMFLLKKELRMAGYDQSRSRRFTLVSLSPFEFTYDVPDNTGEFDGKLDPIGESFSYVLNGTDLVRTNVTAFTVANNIQAMGLAFAFDRDNDGQLDTYDVGGNPFVIWAVDTDGDERLDYNLDSNADGVINAADDTDGNGVINTADGAALGNTIPRDLIRSIRIWLLARSTISVNNYEDNNMYIAGSQVVDASLNNEFMYQLRTATVRCYNLDDVPFIN